MKKIPTLFLRNPDDRRHVTKEVTPGCEWVISGEGVPTRKYDGTCVMLDGTGRWWARREVKKGKQSPYMFMRVDYDTVTGKQVGWVPIEDSSFYKFFLEALTNSTPTNKGTYELCGPKVNGNPEDTEGHELFSHENADLVWFPFEASAQLIAHTVQKLTIEGVVWRHPDGRMAKLKARDYK